MTPARIMIVEDEPIIAENISMYLNNADFIVSGIAYDDEEARQQLRSNTPDAAIASPTVFSGSGRCAVSTER